MHSSLLAGALALAAGAALAAPAAAQANQIPGTDVKLGLLQSLVSMGRTGTFPNGTNGLAMSTTSCNVGSVQVPWLAAMAEDHPFISFLLVRDDGTRLRQISNRSFVKHGFFALANSQCTPCQGGSPQGLFLGIGCSDTYSTANNGNNFWLGPPEEIDSWLGEWEANCSFFDAGLFPSPPFDCDGSRSFSTTQANSLGPVGNRVQVSDLDLVVAGGQSATFWYQAQYVIRGEPEANRNNNLGSRAFIPTFNAGQNQWNFQIGGGLLEGSVLQRWPGAQHSSATNGSADGRVHVAVKVTGPTNGLYHYEYAIHNRDNQRGVGELRIPVCPGAEVTGLGTLDPDADAANDWSAAVVGSEIVFSANTQPVQWNTIHNFWFDSDAAPTPANLSLPQFQPGPGAAALTIASSAPLGLFNVVTGPGCGAGGIAPTLFATGAPAQATLGNASFGLGTQGHGAGAVVLLYGSPVAGSLPLGAGCTAHLGGVFGAQIQLVATVVADGAGSASIPLPIPADPSFEGLTYETQAASVSGSGGPLLGIGELTNGLRIRIGSSVAPCAN